MEITEGPTPDQPKSFSKMTVDEKAALLKEEKDPFKFAGINNVLPQHSSSYPEESDYDNKFVSVPEIKKLVALLELAKNSPEKLTPESKKRLLLSFQMKKAQYYHGAYILFLLLNPEPVNKKEGKDLLIKYQSSAQEGFKATEESLGREALVREKLTKSFDERFSQAVVRARSNGRAV